MAVGEMVQGLTTEAFDMQGRKHAGYRKQSPAVSAAKLLFVFWIRHNSSQVHTNTGAA